MYNRTDPKGAITVDRNSRRTFSSMVASHYHYLYEIYYLYNGERKYFIKNANYSLTSGDMVLISPMIMHRTIKTDLGYYDRAVLYFTEDIVKEYKDILNVFERDVHKIQFSEKEKTRVEQIFENMLCEADKKEDYWYAALKGCLLELLTVINRSAKGYIEQDKNDVIHFKNQKIRDIVLYTNENFSSSITLKDLSSRFYLSEFYLSRKFKEYTGFTFGKYLIAVRMKHAERLLRNTTMKIWEIALEAGYENPSNFCRSFRAHTGMSPEEYRRNYFKL